jgi:two-component system chemotaxis family response regulator WspR
VEIAEQVGPTTILQDLEMPGVDGFTQVERMRAHPATAAVPIIVLSSREDPRDKSRAFAIGASDYLIKLPDPIELVARIRAHSKSFQAQRERDAAYRQLEELGRQLAEKNAVLERLSSLDGLTGIANRRRLDETLDLEWRRARRDGSLLSLIMIDVDYFKKFNDRYGHLAGDDCLRQVAVTLTGGLHRPADLVARFGGEEFAVLMAATDAAGAGHVAETLRARVEELAIPHERSEIAPCVTISLGSATVRPSDDGVPRTTARSIT